MNQLFLVRHGNYDTKGSLNNEGRQQVTETGIAIKSLLEKSSINVALFSSPTRIGIETMLLLGDILECTNMNEYHTYSCLETRGKEAAEFLKIISASYRPMGVAVTHLEEMAEIPSLILNVNIKEIPERERGTGFYFDLRTKSYQLIPKISA